MSNPAPIFNAIIAATTAMLLISACNRESASTTNDTTTSSETAAPSLAQNSDSCDERHVAAPRGAELIAVLPPSAEGATDSSESFEASGSLIHATENPEHMGVAVESGDKQHVFIFEMDMGSDASQDEVLGLIGTSPTTQVLVRGVAQPAPTGVNNFDSSYCRWVYQLSGTQE